MHSLAPIFSPRSVVVVGPAPRDSIGWSIVHNLISAEFTGAIFPVNPRPAVHSLKCYPSLRDPRSGRSRDRHSAARPAVFDERS
jgi:acyl-CoA synthetase (NDP forming)